MARSFRSDTFYLAGSLPLNTIRLLIMLQSDKLDEEIVKLVYSGNEEELNDAVISPRGVSLEEYYKRYELPLKLLQTPEAMFYAGRGVAQKLIANHIRHAEILYAVSLHCEQIENGSLFNHSKHMLESFMNGIESAKKNDAESNNKRSDLKCNVIISLMENEKFSKEKNKMCRFTSIMLADSMRDKGISGIDIVGSGSKYSTHDPIFYMNLANDAKVPFIFHAGEYGEAEECEKSIRAAIEHGARRICHSTSLIWSESLRNFVKEHDVTVEVSLSRDVDIGLVKAMSDHPIKKLWAEGIRVTVSSDNMTTSTTDMSGEYMQLGYLGFSKADIYKMQMYAVDSAILSKNERSKIKKNYGPKM